MAGNVVEELIKSIQQEPKKQSRAVAAVVARIDGEGVVWVRLAGSEQETPTASASAEVKPGDVVTVEWRNKKLYIGGNYSNPSAGIQRILITEANMNAATNLLGTFDKKVDNFMRIAGDTTQYFWHTETGTDTGAHITEIPKDDFLIDPTNGGSNLLARSNGIAVRDGLAELAMFGANGIQIGQSGQTRTVIGAHLIQMIDGTDDAAYSYNPSGYFTVVSGRDNVIYNKYQSEVEPNESYSSSVRTYTLSDWYGIADTNKFYFTYGLKSTAHPYITSVTCNFERGTLKSYTNYGITCAYDGNSTITMSSSGSSSEYGGLMYYTYDIERTAPGCIIGRLLEQYGLGDYAVSAGYNNEVIGQYAFGTGFQNRVCGQADHVTGTNNFSSGGNCHVEGTHNEVTGSCSHAEGEYVRVSGQHAHGSGLGTVVSSDNQTVIGKYNVEDANDDYAFVVGNGTDEDNRSNALTVDWNGKVRSTNPNISTTTTPSTDQWIPHYNMADSTGYVYGVLQGDILANGKTGVTVQTQRLVNGTRYQSGMRLYLNSDGSPQVVVDHPEAWRNALGVNIKTYTTTITTNQYGEIQIPSVLSSKTILSVKSNNYQYGCFLAGSAVRVFKVSATPLAWAASTSITFIFTYIQ